MIIAMLKEGSAGPLPLSGAAPANYLGGVERKKEDEGEQGENKANVIIAQIISKPVQETSEVFFTLTFLTQCLAKKGRYHDSTLLSAAERQGQCKLSEGISSTNTHHPDFKRPTFISISAIHSILSPALMCCGYLSSGS